MQDEQIPDHGEEEPWYKKWSGESWLSGGPLRKYNFLFKCQYKIWNNNSKIEQIKNKNKNIIQFYQIFVITITNLGGNDPREPTFFALLQKWLILVWEQIWLISIWLVIGYSHTRIIMSHSWNIHLPIVTMTITS